MNTLKEAREAALEEAAVRVEGMAMVEMEMGYPYNSGLLEAAAIIIRELKEVE